MKIFAPLTLILHNSFERDLQSSVLLLFSLYMKYIHSHARKFTVCVGMKEVIVLN